MAPDVLIAFLGRSLLGLGMALVFSVLGIIVGRMGVLLFGVTSWNGWLIMLIAGAGIGAAFGSVGAWLWLKGLGTRFTISLAIIAGASGVMGSWLAYGYGAGVQGECCASPDMGPIAYAALGAVAGSNVASLVCAAVGQTTIRLRRASRMRVGAANAHPDRQGAL